MRAGTGAKLSLGSGLVYVHELLQDTGMVNAWYITALDFATGDGPDRGPHRAVAHRG